MKDHPKGCSSSSSAENKKMVRTPCCEKMGLKKGPWTPQEDQILVSFVQQFGHGNWRALPKQAGLLRCGKSCRLRWINYLRPDIKRGNFTKEEEETIIKLHQLLGNRWSAIAAKLPGRTDNEIKNYWHTRLKKRPNHMQDLATIRQQQCSNETVLLQATMLPIQENSTSCSRIQSPTNTPISPPQLRLELRDPVEMTTGQVGGEASSDGSPGKAHGIEEKCVAAMEDIKCDNSDDMEFWYNVFIKAGNSTLKCNKI